MVILDGKRCSQNYRQLLKEKVELLKNELNSVPGLAVVIVGEDPASKIYVNNNIKACEEIGIYSKTIRLDESVSQQEVEDAVINLANDSSIDGIIVQLPLPRKFDSANILRHIPANKDVDGWGIENLGKLLTGEKCLISCTPNGIIKLLKDYGVSFTGKNAVVIGRSNMVGKPISLLLQQENCTVTMCHSKSVNLQEFTKKADILVVAIGKDRFVTGDMVKEGAIVIDVGMNRVDGKLYGDVDYVSVSEKSSMITPVPGGVGPMTVTMLMYNTVTAFIRKYGKDEI